MANEITKRLLEVFEYSKKSFGIVNAVAFEKRTKIAGGSLYKWLREGKDASIDSVVKILTAFPSISAEWLIRGTGSMESAASQASLPSSVVTEVKDSDYVKHLEEENRFLRDQLKSTLSALNNAHSYYAH